MVDQKGPMPGLEEVMGQDLGTPFLVICQANSPQLTQGHANYIEEARPGMIINIASNKVYRDLKVVVVRFAHRLMEWKANRQSQAPEASYRRGQEPKDIVIDTVTGKLARANGNVIVPTNYYLVMVKEDGWDKAIIPMSSTQMKVSRRWNSTMLSYEAKPGDPPAAAFSLMYTLTTKPESNTLGRWFSWHVESAGVTDITIYQKALEAYEQMENFLPEKFTALIGNGGNGGKDVM